MASYYRRTSFESSDSVEMGSIPSYTYHECDWDTLLHEDGYPRLDTASDSATASERPFPETFSGKSYIPIAPPSGYPNLEFKPLILKRWFLTLTLLFFSSILAILIIAIVKHRSDPEAFHIHTPANYVLMTTAPAIVGTITTIWWRAMVETYRRTMPYIAIAKTPTTVGTRNPQHFQTLAAIGSLCAIMLRPSDFAMLAQERHFLTIIITVTSLFVIPLLTPLKNSLINVVGDETGWDVVLSENTAIALSVIYGFMAFCTFLIIVRTCSSYTGLKWDPSPLAAQISLIQGSNVAQAFRDFEYSLHRYLIHELRYLGATLGILRLGYWQASDDEGDIFYGIRFMNGNDGKSFISRDTASNNYDPIESDPGAIEHIDHKMGGKCHESPYSAEERPVIGGEIACSPEYARYRMTYLNLSDAWLIFMSLFDVGMIISCIVAIVKGCVRPDGNFATIPLKTQSRKSRQQTRGRTATPTEIFYTTGVGILIALFSIIWVPAENFYRRMEPFAGMALPKQAEENMLLDYVGPNAVQVLLTAVQNHHWRVACFSVLANFHTFTPILARKAFVFVNEGSAIRVKAVPAWFYVCFSILILYLPLMLYARPPWRYRTPRDIQSFVDVISFCAYSRVIDSREFNIQDPTDEEIHFFSHIHAEKNRYLFGFYLGKDGRRHLGFDVAERHEGDRVVCVDVVDPGVFLDFFGFQVRFKRPQIVPVDERLITTALAVPRMESLSSRQFRKRIGRGSLLSN